MSSLWTAVQFWRTDVQRVCRLALSGVRQFRTCETAGSIDYVVSKEFFLWRAYCVQAFADAARTNVIVGRYRNVSAMLSAGADVRSAYCGTFQLQKK